MMQTDTIIPSYNLWIEPWITLEDRNGVLTNHGIAETLLVAHQYLAVYDPSPLVVVGIHRLLTAILQDALNPQENAELEELWERGSFPKEAIISFGDRYADRFDLFSPDKPFYQSSDLPVIPQTKSEMASVAKLFQDFPSGSFLTHYRHITEDEHVFSCATAASGLLAISPFASVGGKGNMPSINGVPPIYVLPAGKTLFDSLLASLISVQTLGDIYATQGEDLAWWERPTPVIIEMSKKKKAGMSIADSKQLSEAGYLHGLTFPARKVRLHPIQVDAACTRSGQACTWGVSTMAFQMGESLLEDAPVWTDPFVAYRLPPRDTGKGRTAKQGKKSDRKKPIRPMRGRAAWREFGGLFLQGSTAEKQTQRPLFLDQLSKLSISRQFEVYPFRCIALQTDGKMKFFEWTDFGFDVPPSLLADPQGAFWIERAIQFADVCAEAIQYIFSKHFSPEMKKRERYKRIKTRMSEDFWSSSAGQFRQFVLEMGDRNSQTQSIQNWFDTMTHLAQAVFNVASDSIGDDGPSLAKIVQARSGCAGILSKLRSKYKE